MVRNDLTAVMPMKLNQHKAFQL